MTGNTSYELEMFSTAADLPAKKRRITSVVATCGEAESREGAEGGNGRRPRRPRRRDLLAPVFSRSMGIARNWRMEWEPKDDFCELVHNWWVLAGIYSHPAWSKSYPPRSC